MKKIILSIMFAFVGPITGMENLLQVVDEALQEERQARMNGLVEMLGLRPTMEDETDVQVNDDHAFFAVYDGHGGRAVATIAKYNLYKMCQLTHANTDDEIKAALRNGFLTMQQGLSKALDFMGSTATVTVIKNGKIFVANAGDSRTVLCNNGTAIPLSQDHKPSREDEKKRIEDLGGRVVLCDTWRVNGILAVSRALGDKHLHPYVIAEPEITVRALDPQDEFLILACDGIWDVLDNQSAVNHVNDTLSQHDCNCTKAARSLAHEALTKKSTDNISAIVVNLKSFPQE
jgi:protein phosphatase 1L